MIGSKGYRLSINSKGDFDKKIIYYPNWVEDTLNEKERRGVPDLPAGFNIMIAGNMGDAQDLPHVMDTALRLRGEKINFIFVGDGRKKSYVERFAQTNGLKSQIHCLGRFPLESMPSLFRKTDVLFMALKNEPIFEITVPSRLQAYMSSGKPVVSMINGEGADLIQEADCGWSVSAEDSEALADLLLKLSKEDKSVLEQKGKNGKLYSQKHFNFKNSIDRLEIILKGTLPNSD